MEQRNYQLKLNKYWIDNISFKANKSFIWPKGGATMDPSYERNVVKLDDNTALVTIVFDIPTSNNRPFSLHLDVNGVFELENWSEDEMAKILISDNASAILFPYLRQAISEITTISGLPTYVIPIQNMASLFNKNENAQ